jgi:hypothetical protein
LKELGYSSNLRRGEPFRISRYNIRHRGPLARLPYNFLGLLRTHAASERAVLLLSVRPIGKKLVERASSLHGWLGIFIRSEVNFPLLG